MKYWIYVAVFIIVGWLLLMPISTFGQQQRPFNVYRSGGFCVFVAGSVQQTIAITVWPENLYGGKCPVTGDRP